MQKISIGNVELGVISGNKLIMNERLDLIEVYYINGISHPISTVWVKDRRKRYFMPNTYLVWSFNGIQIIFYWDGRNLFEVASIEGKKVLARHRDRTYTGYRRKTSELFVSAHSLKDFEEAKQTLKLFKMKPLVETIDMSGIDISLLSLEA